MRKRNSILGFALLVFASPNAEGAPERSPCPVSASNVVQDKEFAECEARVRYLRVDVPREVAAASGKLSQLADQQMQAKRRGDSDCSDIVAQAVGSNSAGSGTLSVASTALEKLRLALTHHQLYFAAQLKKLEGAGAADTVLQPQAKGQAAQLLPRLRDEHEKGAKLAEAYLQQVRQSAAGAKSTREQLASLSARSARVNCDSLQTVVEDPNGAVKTGQRMQEASRQRVAENGDEAFSRNSSVTGPNQGSVIGDPDPTLAHPGVYVDRDGNKVFVSKQKVADGRTVYMTVIEDKNGKQFTAPISSGDYDRFLSLSGSSEAVRAEAAKALMSQGVTPVYYTGAKLVPGSTDGVYKGGQTENPWFAGGGAPPTLNGQIVLPNPGISDRDGTRVTMPAGAMPVPENTTPSGFQGVIGDDGKVRAPASVEVPQGTAPAPTTAASIVPAVYTQPRAPDGSVPAPTLANYQQFDGMGRFAGNGQCVSLLLAADSNSALGNSTDNWVRGEPVRGNNILPGTPIATFTPSGTYGNNTDGTSHAAIFDSYDPNGKGIYVIDQWNGTTSQTPKKRLIPWDGMPGEPASKLSNRGSAFYVINLRSPNRQVANANGK